MTLYQILVPSTSSSLRLELLVDPAPYKSKSGENGWTCPWEKNCSFGSLPTKNVQRPTNMNWSSSSNQYDMSCSHARIPNKSVLSTPAFKLPHAMAGCRQKTIHITESPVTESDDGVPVAEQRGTGIDSGSPAGRRTYRDRQTRVPPLQDLE